MTDALHVTEPTPDAALLAALSEAYEEWSDATTFSTPYGESRKILVEKAAGKVAPLLAAERNEREMADGCLIDIADFLSKQKCKCGDGGESKHSTPPMFYPEWIGCVLEAEREQSSEIIAGLVAKVSDERERLEVVRADLVNETVARLKAEQERDAAVRRAEEAIEHTVDSTAVRLLHTDLAEARRQLADEPPDVSRFLWLEKQLAEARAEVDRLTEDLSQADDDFTVADDQLAELQHGQPECSDCTDREMHAEDLMDENKQLIALAEAAEAACAELKAGIKKTTGYIRADLKPSYKIDHILFSLERLLEKAKPGQALLDELARLRMALEVGGDGYYIAQAALRPEGEA